MLLLKHIVLAFVKVEAVIDIHMCLPIFEQVVVSFDQSAKVAAEQSLSQQHWKSQVFCVKSQRHFPKSSFLVTEVVTLLRLIFD